jgi:hypothetical protein
VPLCSQQSSLFDGQPDLVGGSSERNIFEYSRRTSLIEAVLNSGSDSSSVANADAKSLGSIGRLKHSTPYNGLPSKLLDVPSAI